MNREFLCKKYLSEDTVLVKYVYDPETLTNPASLEVIGVHKFPEKGRRERIYLSEAELDYYSLLAWDYHNYRRKDGNY